MAIRDFVGVNLRPGLAVIGKAGFDRLEIFLDAIEYLFDGV